MKHSGLKQGQRVKIGLANSWCQTSSNKQIIWMKGRVKEIKNDVVVVSCKWNKYHHYFKIERLMCFSNEDGDYPNIKKI